MIATTSPLRADILALRPSGIGRISALGEGREGLIPLWFGESDLVTPDFVREAAKQALDDGLTFYSSSRGVPRLREGIRDWTRRFVGAQIDLARITVPGSAMLSVMLALQCVVRQGDEVVVISPMWPNIFQAVEVVGGVPRFVRLRRDGDGPWWLDMDAVVSAFTPRTRAVFLASPSNPTGWVMSAAEQTTLLEVCRARGIAIIADEVYGPIVFDGLHAPSFLSIASDDDAVFVVDSFSKAWAMTGWRVGWLVHPTRMADPIATMAVVANTGASSFAQAGAIAAIERGDEFIAAMRDRVRGNLDQLDLFVRSQPRLDWAKPAGGFYGYVAIDGVTDSMAFATTLLDRVAVGVAPGSAFGPADDRDNDRYVRICMAYDAERTAVALARIGRVLATL